MWTKILRHTGFLPDGAVTMRLQIFNRPGYNLDMHLKIDTVHIVVTLQ